MTIDKESPSTSNNITIRDPHIEPFYIVKDQYCYTIFKTIQLNPNYTDGGGTGKEYQKAIGHFSSFSNVLKSLAKEKQDNIKNYSSIKEYIQSFKDYEKSIKELFQNLNID